MNERTKTETRDEVAGLKQPVVSVHSDAMDAARYRWMKRNFEWRRSGKGLTDPESHAFVGCRFPYSDNFGCAAMLDHNIDRMIGSEVCGCCNGTGKIKDSVFVDGDYESCMTCNGTGR